MQNIISCRPYCNKIFLYIFYIKFSNTIFYYRVLTACKALLASSAFDRDIRSCKNNLKVEVGKYHKASREL
jgi:hypothetical protein